MNPAFSAAGYERCRLHRDWCRAFLSPHGRWADKACVMCAPRKWVAQVAGGGVSMQIYPHAEIPTSKGFDWRTDPALPVGGAR